MRVKTITCPNCGHANNFLAEECTQCGINFSRYYEELEKTETLRRHIEEQEKAEALRHEQEEQKRREAEERQRQQEEQARIAAEERERIEEEKRLEAERLREEQERADVLKRQQEALAAAEALQRQQEEERARLATEAREREKEGLATETRDSENERVPEEKATANIAADSSNPAGDANAVEIEELETADIEEYAGAFDFIEYPAEEPSDADHVDNTAALDASPHNHRPASSLEERLRIHEGRMLGLTYGDPAEIQNVKLLAVNSDHFQVFYPISRNVVSFPYNVIMSITENVEGLSAVGPDISPVFPMVVELPRPFFHAV